MLDTDDVKRLQDKVLAARRETQRLRHAIEFMVTAGKIRYEDVEQAFAIVDGLSFSQPDPVST